MTSRELSDEQVIVELQERCAEGCRVNAQIVGFLVVVEERGLHRELAYSSMFDFCLRRLKMSEGEAYRRINAARLVRKFPDLLEHIARNEVHLSSLVLLRDYLTDENYQELISLAAHKTKREVRAILAERFGVLEPAFKIFVQASPTLWRKLQEALDLSRHENPKGDIAIAIERSLDAYLAQMKKSKRAETDRPLSTLRKPVKAGTIPADARREVFARDGERCTFIDTSGARCPATSFLELDHIVPRARGGSGGAANLRVRCRQHNLQHAKACFGRERLHLRRRKSKR